MEISHQQHSNGSYDKAVDAVRLWRNLGNGAPCTSIHTRSTQTWIRAQCPCPGTRPRPCMVLGVTLFCASVRSPVFENKLWGQWRCFNWMIIWIHFLFSVSFDWEYLSNIQCSVWQCLQKLWFSSKILRCASNISTPFPVSEMFSDAAFPVRYITAKPKVSSIVVSSRVMLAIW